MNEQGIYWPHAGELMEVRRILEKHTSGQLVAVFRIWIILEDTAPPGSKHENMETERLL